MIRRKFLVPQENLLYFNGCTKVASTVPDPVIKTYWMSHCSALRETPRIKSRVNLDIAQTAIQPPTFEHIFVENEKTIYNYNFDFVNGYFDNDCGQNYPKINMPQTI